MTKQIYQHGETLLMEVKKTPKLKSEKHKNFILAHSETGHHHVLESETEFEVMTDKEKDELFVRLYEPAKLVHKKTVDFHRTLDIKPGIYRLFKKTEYDPFAGLIKEVKD